MVVNGWEGITQFVNTRQIKHLDEFLTLKWMFYYKRKIEASIRIQVYTNIYFSQDFDLRI